MMANVKWVNSDGSGVCEKRKEKVQLRVQAFWTICQSRHYLTPNAIEASASSAKKKKKKRKNPISSSLSKISPSRCQKVCVNGLSNQPSPYGTIHKIRWQLTNGKIQRLVKICRRRAGLDRFKKLPTWGGWGGWGGSMY